MPAVYRDSFVQAAAVALSRAFIFVACVNLTVTAGTKAPRDENPDNPTDNNKCSYPYGMAETSHVTYGMYNNT